VNDGSIESEHKRLVSEGHTIVIGTSNETSNESESTQPLELVIVTEYAPLESESIDEAEPPLDHAKDRESNVQLTLSEILPEDVPLSDRTSEESTLNRIGFSTMTTWFMTADVSRQVSVTVKIRLRMAKSQATLSVMMDMESATR
jgi:hypothetical protein